MKISYNWLQQYFEKPLPKAHDLAELINAHVFEVESIEKFGGNGGAGAKADTVFDIKVLPDRAHYALCHKGISREVKAITGLEMKPVVTITATDAVTIDKNTTAVQVKVDDKKLCRRYMARRINDIKITDSPAWLREKLEAIGARSINMIVDATNYVMFDIGQPLHAFDADKVKGAISVRLAKKVEKIELLPERVLVDGTWVEKARSLELGETDLVIADDEGPIAIAGVKGGKRAEISATTKDIILESANFNPVSVRRTSTRLNVRNDSSKRFENEIIPELAEQAMEQVTALICSLSAAAKAGKTTDVFSMPTKPWNVSVSPDLISSKLGASVSADRFKEVLKRYDCAVADAKSPTGSFTITPPLDRLDLKIPEDFVDETARVNGYESLSAVLPPMLPPEMARSISDDAGFYWSEKVKNILINLGFSETLLYSLVPKGFYEITYPLASDKSALRESIVSKIRESLAMNALNAGLLGADTIKIFEIGKVFPKTGEKTVLTMGVAQVKKEKGVTAMTHLATAIEFIKKELGVAELPRATKDSLDIVEIDFDKLVSLLKEKSAKPVSITDLDFQALPRNQRYHPFSLYPFITRDIAVFVPETIIGDGVWKAIKEGVQEAGAEDLLVRDSLFDVFKKGDKVSYAYRLVFQSYKKTLTDDEVNKIMEMVYTEVKEKGWEVR